jgi:hypothetical protein
MTLFLAQRQKCYPVFRGLGDGSMARLTADKTRKKPAQRETRGVSFALPPEIVERIDDFRFEKRLPSRTAAIRLMIEAGLSEAKALKQTRS